MAICRCEDCLMRVHRPVAFGFVTRQHRLRVCSRVCAGGQVSTTDGVWTRLRGRDGECFRPLEVFRGAGLHEPASTCTGKVRLWTVVSFGNNIPFRTSNKNACSHTGRTSCPRRCTALREVGLFRLIETHHPYYPFTPWLASLRKTTEMVA
ncbi:hypothetical protein BU26DRAFT_35579 [Trematosphaeria pertusa]|uniref:Uncharacterized protein n=1 Tax=Trematosphaeria pertusa TaxID=390896 RepID=A0A6A6J5B1_9PLEO|nr:uncharacterized protein BU26DRAFT_35579 [Trematosphaeria pertusa]KAF2257070.1 hypothetical protein BU26DRAFT_35579 [Trematosphaeria pertusa]